MIDIFASNEICTTWKMVMRSCIEGPFAYFRKQIALVVLWVCFLLIILGRHEIVFHLPHFVVICFGWDIFRCAYVHGSWASYQIRKCAGCARAGNAGNIFQPPRVNYPDMHHGTCVTHVPWCMPGSLTSGFLWNRWRGKRSWHSRRMRNMQFYVSGKRPIAYTLDLLTLSGRLTTATLTIIRLPQRQWRNQGIWMRL